MPAEPASPIILINDVTLEKIWADADRYAGRSERGGILLGFRRGPHLHIADATLPMKWDLGSKFAFHRSARGHQQAAKRRWQKTSHTADWIGEWHSHPESRPSPSTVDLRSWREMTMHRGVPMVFVIVGYDEVWVGLCIPGLAKVSRYRAKEASSLGTAYVAE